MTVNVHHNAVTGEIFSFGSSEHEPAVGNAVTKITFTPGSLIYIDATKQRIDVEYGALIDKTPEEQAATSATLGFR